MGFLPEVFSLKASAPSEEELITSLVLATSLSVAGEISGVCACTVPLAKNISAATATLAAPKWYFLIE